MSVWELSFSVYNFRWHTSCLVVYSRTLCHTKSPQLSTRVLSQLCPNAVP
jgi:endonuclease III